MRILVHSAFYAYPIVCLRNKRFGMEYSVFSAKEGFLLRSGLWGNI